MGAKICDFEIGVEPSKQINVVAKEGKIDIDVKIVL